MDMVDTLEGAPGDTKRADRAALTPDFSARDLRFGLAAKPVRHWLDHDLYKTAVADGLSIFLPTGERFFIRSIKHYLPQVQDEALKLRIREFVLQEAYHTREHEDYNRAVDLLGYDLAELEKPVKEALRYNRTMIEDLAVTCAVEHITASISHLILSHPEMWGDSEPRYRRMWTWHALEEIEHKAVAMELFGFVTRNWSPWKRYLFRNAAMTIVLWRFMKIFFRNARLYARRDGVTSFWRYAAGMTKVLLIKPGFWRIGMPEVLTYYKPGFDPGSRNDQKLIDRALAELAVTEPTPA